MPYLKPQYKHQQKDYSSTKNCSTQTKYNWIKKVARREPTRFGQAIRSLFLAQEDLLRKGLKLSSSKFFGGDFLLKDFPVP